MKHFTDKTSLRIIGEIGTKYKPNFRGGLSYIMADQSYERTFAAGGDHHAGRASAALGA
jgi:hypothetical protein